MSSEQDRARAALVVAAAATVALTAAIGLFVFALLSVGAFFTASNNSAQQLNDCGVVPSVGAAATVPRATGTIAQQQDKNARLIEQGVRAAGGSGRAVYVALVAAVGESDLINVDYGDKTGPDSRGTFQQRKNWGTLAQRMNPAWAAGAFMLGPHQGGKGGLLQLPEWEQLPVTTAIHRVQINRDPNHYNRFEARAREIGQKAGVNFSAPAGTTQPGTASCAGATDPNDTSLTLDNPSGKTTMDGKTVSRIVAAQILLAERESSIEFRVMQGGFGGSGFAASGTSHNYSGVVDVSPGTVEAEKVLRRAGFAAWSRNVPGRSYVGSGIHVHAVSLLDPGNKNHPQVTGSWARGENGLNGGHDPAPHYDWYPALRKPR